MSQADFSRKLNIRAKEISRAENLEIKKKSFHISLEKVAKILECHIKYIFIPEKEMIAGVPLDNSSLLRELKHFSLIFQKPVCGWIQAIRKARGMTQSQLEEKENYSKEYIHKIENAEISGLLIPGFMRNMAKALGGRFEYMLIPMSPLYDEALFKKLEQASSQFYRPQEGWFCFMRKFLSITPKEVAIKANVSSSFLSYVERSEVCGMLVPLHIRKVAHALGGRLEYVLIPNKSLGDLISMNSVLGQFSQVPEKPLGGWIQSMRLTMGLSKSQLAKISNLDPQQISYIEKNESQDKFVYASLNKIAHALGGRFEYVLIPEKSLITPLPFPSESIPHNRSLVTPPLSKNIEPNF